MDRWKKAFVYIAMNWLTCIILLPLLCEASFQFGGSSHSTSSSSSSSSTKLSSTSSSTPHSGHQGFSNFAPRSTNTFQSFGSSPNSEMHRIVPNGNRHPQGFQNNGGLGSESYAENLGQTFETSNIGSHISSTFPNEHQGHMMPLNHGQQLAHHNGQIKHQTLMDPTEQHSKTVHQGQSWTHGNPGQLHNQQSGKIGQTSFDNIHAQQRMLKPNEQHHAQNHPGQHMIHNVHGQQRVIKSPQQPQTHGHSKHQVFHNFQGQEFVKSPEQSPTPLNLRQHMLNNDQGHQRILSSVQQPQFPANQGSQNFHEFPGHEIMNTPGNQNLQNPFGQEMSSHTSQSQHTQHIMPGMTDQNLMQIHPPQHVLHGHNGPQLIRNIGREQNQDHQLAQNQGNTQSQEFGQSINPVKMSNGQQPFENFQSGLSHSFSTNNVGKSVWTPDANFPKQFAKSESSSSASSMNTGDTFYKTSSFDRSFFPRNFVIPERLRNNGNMFPSGSNPFPPTAVRNSVTPNPPSSQNPDGTSQMNSRNVFGFEPVDRRHEVFQTSGQFQNMSSFPTNFQFENWDPLREQGVRRADVFDFQVPTCTEEYQKLPNHTMCLVDTPNLNISGVSESEQLEIVRLHNDLRGSVLPEASDIFAMKWDDRLAIVAQKWANQCSRFHDKMRTVPSLGKHTLIGQNLAGGFSNWSLVIKEWWTENVIWQYGIEPSTYIPETSDVAETIGHYIQMTYNATYLVGCGFAYCDDSRYEKYYVCNYAPGLRSFTHPFTRGERCSACPHWCRNGKCDCGGRVCNNGGILNMKTCQCECGPLYAGPSCDILRCPFQDQPSCGSEYQREHCVVLPKVNQDCPYMCGRCARGQFFCGGRVCYNGGVLKETTCRCSCSPPYTGETCEANCSDPDDGQCNRWPDVFCHWNPQIQKQCPHRCNLCSSQ